MHILFVSGEYPSMPGGVGAYTAELGEALLRQGVRVSVVTSQAVRSDAAVPSDVRVYPDVASWKWPIWRQIGDLATAIAADWIHVQYQTAAFAMHPAVNFAPARWRRHHLVAWTYHDLLVPYLFPKAGARLRRWVTEWPAARCHLTVVTNEGDRLQLADRDLPALAAIPIGSNIRGRRLSPSERAAHRRELGYAPHDLVLAYFGFLNRSKGGLTLIRTLERLVPDLPHVRLLMIGERVGASDPSNYAYLQEVEGLIARLGLVDRVQWTGRRPQEMVAADLNACDVLLMPYEDGASLRRGTLMAGLANGCAIVTTTPQSPLPELEDGRDLIYTAPGDHEAMAQAVARLAASPQLVQELRTNAYLRSRLFTWEAIATRHVDLYRQIMDRARES